MAGISGNMIKSKVKLQNYLNELKKVDLKLQTSSNKKNYDLKHQKTKILKSIQTLTEFLNSQSKLSLAEQKKLHEMGLLKKIKYPGYGDFQ